MRNTRSADLSAMIRAAAERLGHNAPLVADDILAEAFPRTMEEAASEGATSYLRAGFIVAVKRVLRSGAVDGAQTDFERIAEGFRPFVRGLRQDSYFVEGRGEYVTIGKLIAQPALLDDARKHLRRKGDETLDEARRLDQLYAAVTDLAPPRSRRKRLTKRDMAEGVSV